ncbi:predicted protein [Plenodomus lingam JN3]|uniref:Predicted protein n=1 Tax=Leptosphaeria maculans (strain JN3 / isolate v23.1.3 / race Av1-4-5-6-7-8) TaxID=985895 RepID=E5AEV0_LEPMJ|nr:predicted protein [Plenodomus lingam JN3]CBY01739.1 predicted protein [Plenodomus lingam JN3]
MTGRILTLGALVALSQAKAIVTNSCPHDVYIWSVPQSGSSKIVGLPVKSGGHYEEAWRRGTAITPGIAIKISAQPDGINKGGDEIDFAYSVAGPNKSQVWVDLSAIRGKTFDNVISFNTCHGSYNTTNITTRQCKVSDDIELTLCGATVKPSSQAATPTNKVFPSVFVGLVPSVPEKATSSISSERTQCDVSTTTTVISKVSTPKDSSSSKSSYSTTSSKTEFSHWALPKVTEKQKSSPKLSTMEPHPTSELVSSKPVYSSPAAVTSSFKYSAPPASVVKPSYAPPEPATDKATYSAPRPLPSKSKMPGPGPSPLRSEYAPPGPASSSVQYAPPTQSSTKPYSPPRPVDEYSGPSKPTYALPSDTSDDSYNRPEKSEEYTRPSKPTAYHVPPHFSGKPEAPMKPIEGRPDFPVPASKPSPPSYTSHELHGAPSHTRGYSGPPKAISDYAPPKTISHYASPSSASATTKKGYAAPPKETDSHDPPSHHEHSQGTPSKESSYAHPGPPKHAGDHLVPSEITDSKSYSPPKHTEGHHGPPRKPTGAQYAPPTSASQEEYGPTKPTSAGYHDPPVHGPPTAVSKIYNAPSPPDASKSHPTVKGYGHGPPRVTSDEPVYHSPSHTSQGPPRRPSGKPEYSPEEEEQDEAPHALHESHMDEPDYSTPKPSKSQPQHPHSPPSEPFTEESNTPSKWPAHPPHAKSTEQSYKTTIGKPYPSPPEPTYGNEDRRLKSSNTVHLSAMVQREAAKINPQDAPKACLSWFHEPSLPELNVVQARLMLEGALYFGLGKSIHDVMNVNSTECPGRVPRLHDGRSAVCVKPLCAKIDASCSDLKDTLGWVTESLFDEDIDYTTDEEVCV